MYQVADSQLNDAISSSDSWKISEEVSEDENGAVAAGLKPTTSARQIKALIEQITGQLKSFEMTVLTFCRPICAATITRISSAFPYLDPASHLGVILLSCLRFTRRL